MTYVFQARGECRLESKLIKLTASADLAQIGPSAVGQTFPDLGSHDHPVAPADVFYLIVYGEYLHTSDLNTHIQNTISTPAEIYYSIDFAKQALQVDNGLFI